MVALEDGGELVLLVDGGGRISRWSTVVSQNVSRGLWELKRQAFGSHSDNPSDIAVLFDICSDLCLTSSRRIEDV